MKRSWIVITKDKRNRYNEWEKVAVRRYKVKEFYFASGNISGAEMAATLLLALPAIREICRVGPPPVIGSISRSGAVTIVEDSHGSTHQRRTGKSKKQ